MITMTKKTLTVLIFDSTGNKVRQASLPKLVLPVSVLLFFGMTILLFLGLFNYHRLQDENKIIHDLRARLTVKEELVAQQQDQIDNFSNKICDLNSKLAELHNFEKKIRVIANLDPKDKGEELFGVGGSNPEDLDPGTFVEKQHQDLVRDMHVRINAIDRAADDQQASFSSIFGHLEEKRNLLAATPSIRPVTGWISSSFGYRSSPFTHRREFHRGMDIATHAGEPIVAPADGAIIFAGKKGLMGNMVTIDHGFGMVTRYGHIQKFLKKRGERVKRGETIALVGNTGRSTGPHLHYEVRLNGVAVNPKNYFFD